VDVSRETSGTGDAEQRERRSYTVGEKNVSRETFDGFLR